MTFRRELISAAEASFAKGELDRNDLLRLRVASLNPRVCNHLEQAIREQIILEQGAEVMAIDWQAIGDFLIKIWPLIMQLIGLIGNGG